AGLQYGFGKDVMELQAMLGARMIQSNGQMAAPIFRTGSAEGQEHGLEQRAALVSAFQFLRGNVQAAELQAQSVDQLAHRSALTNTCQILIQNGFAGTPGETAFGIGGQGPVAQLLRLVVAQRIVAAVSEIRQYNQQEGRRQQRRAIDAQVAPGEVEREFHSLAG